MSTMLLDIGFVFGPIVGFIPQIYKGVPLYKPELSLLTILSFLLKLFKTNSEELDKILQYQFYVAIFLHIYLIRLHSLKEHQQRIKILGLWFYEDAYYTHLVPTLMLLLISLKTFDMVGMSSLFVPAATLIDIIIAFLHLDIYSKQESKPRELFIVWLVGDIIRIFLMISKYVTPKIVILGCIVQLVINVYVGLR